MSDNKQQQVATEALATIKAVYDDGLATINGKDYEFTKTTHRIRRKVFAFYTQHANAIRQSDFSFLDTQGWDEIEKLLNDLVLVDGVQISKRENGAYWDSNPGDYLKFVSVALPVISYPFLQGGVTS